MSGWDFIFTGLELMTYNQARKARQSLKDMQTAQEIAAAEKAMLAAMREFIFDIAKDVQLAEPNIDTYPQQVYVVSNVLGWRLHDSGLSADMFPEFSDKDYIFKTQQKLVEVVNKAKQRLLPQQIQQADLAVKYINEMPLLIQTTQAKSALEQIQATQTKWDKVSKDNSSKTNAGCLSVAGILGTFFGASIICSIGTSIANAISSGISGISGNNDIGGFAGIPALGISYLLGFAALVAGVIFFGKKLLKALSTKGDPDEKILREKRSNWQKSLMPADEWEKAKQTFGGDLSSGQFKRMYNDRIAYVEPMMGKDYVRTLLPAGL